MVSEITKILSKEHKNILKAVEALDKECDKISKGKELDKDFLLKVIDFIRNYADKFHHAKEEDILFKEFCKASEEGEVHCNPVEQMLFEHDVGRGAVKEMKKGLEENNKEMVVRGAREYINVIREHVYNEDNILYPMADEALSDEVKEEMLEKFNDINEKRAKETEKYVKFASSI